MVNVDPLTAKIESEVWGTAANFNGQVQNLLCVQALRYPILTALLHGTRVVDVSKTLRH